MMALSVEKRPRQDALASAIHHGSAAAVAHLYGRIAFATFERPGQFASELVSALKDELDLEAASLYIQTPGRTGLNLRAAAGFDYHRYRSFQLPMNSYPGVAIRENALYLTDTAPFSTDLYRDQGLLEGKDIAGIVVIPFTRPVRHKETGIPEVLGCLCLYPRRLARLSPVADTASAAAPLVATLYLAALDRLQMHLRDLTVRQVAFRRDVGSLVHKFVEVFKEQLACDAVSAWILDPRRAQLYLRGTTGISGPTRLSERRLPLTDEGIVGRAFQTGQPIVHTQGAPEIDPESLLERLPAPLQNGLVLPIKMPEPVRIGGTSVGTVGVLVLLNKFTTFADVCHYTDFSWEDVAVAEFATEMLAVLIYQLLRTRDHEGDYERQMHGARTNLQCTKSNLQLLEDRIGIRDLVPERYANYISNCIDWIDDIERQITRDELLMRDDLALSRVGLYGDVLAPVFQLARRRAQAVGLGRLAIVGSEELAHQYTQIPYVRGNSAALISVFRNLVDNSIKYSDPGRGCELSISVKAQGKHVLVEYFDNGIGIPETDLPHIFESGYRGEAARRINAQGLGVGLFDCARLLKRMGGAIDARNARTGAAFRVMLRAWPGS